MDFQDSWWDIYLPSLMILAADIQTKGGKNPTPAIPATADVGVCN